MRGMLYGIFDRFGDFSGGEDSGNLLQLVQILDPILRPISTAPMNKATTRQNLFCHLVSLPAGKGEGRGGKISSGELSLYSLEPSKRMTSVYRNIWEEK